MDKEYEVRPTGHPELPVLIIEIAKLGFSQCSNREVATFTPQATGK
jgi:hypothetical protein